MKTVGVLLLGRAVEGNDMYLPTHFAEIDQTEIAQLVEQFPLACIVAQTSQGLIANHVPLLAAPSGVLIGHFALKNDFHKLIIPNQEILAIFRGEDAYISPNLYPTKAEHHRHVPTWNYQVVHVYGTIMFQFDAPAKQAAVGLLTRTHERKQNGDLGWKMTDAPSDYISDMLDNIVAFKIQPNRIIAKSKLSQNRDPVDHASVTDAMAKMGQHALAGAMQRQRPDAD